MKKKFFFIFFFILFCNQILASPNKTAKNFKGCSYNITNGYPSNIDSLKIELIEVDIHDYRKWTVNGVRILTNRYRFVPDKFKRRYDSTITVVYEDKSVCVLEGRVRHSGDEKDHINQMQNSITQSLDVHLINGNIKGVTKFKLLRPNTRGNLEDEILITEVLRNLDFLAPRTTKVKTRVNKVKTEMIFQEKAAKEMLEYNKRREGPILEADERFFFKLVSTVEDNNLSGWDMGVVPLMNKSSKYMLSKQINANILEKSEGHKLMSLNAVNKLNLIYLHFSNRFQDELNKFNYFDYDLDNNLLGLFDDRRVSKLDEYNLFMQATNSTHGLAANNRKFYWNSIENYFEPINYDSNANINNDISKGTLRYPFSKNLFTAFNELEIKIKNLNQKQILENLILSGLDFTDDQLKKKINKILFNLDKLKDNYLNHTSQMMVKHNETKLLNNVLQKFHKNLKESHPDTFLIKSNLNLKNFQKCEIFLENCLDINLSSIELTSLLEGELSKDDSFYQYLGGDFDFKKSINLNTLKKRNYKKTSIYYENGVDIFVDEINNNIEINQNKSGAKIFFINGELNKVNIIFNGFGFNPDERSEIKPIGFPINQRGLTGCLSLINIKLVDLSINSSNSTCEDSLNFINALGEVNNISIKNSLSDALDIDFSNLKIKNINITKAKNDCVDVSYGNYNIENLNLDDCGDKALSVGEKSNLKLKNIIAKNSNYGVASKDSSIVEMQNANFNSLNICLSAYKKKQEFEGGIIKFGKMNCEFIKDEINYDKHSFIKKL